MFKILKFIFSISCMKSKDYIVMFNPIDIGNKAQELKIYAANIAKIQGYMKNGEKIKSKFTNGYIAQLSNETKEKIEKEPEVAVVEEDQDIQIVMLDTQNEKTIMSSDKFYVERENNQTNIEIQNNAPWGISRISSGIKFNNNTQYQYPASAGDGVDVYVIDTGIEITHPELQGRARWGANLVEYSRDTDEHGHGTHCAGTIGGKTVGIAKKANLIAVKVLDKNGQGKISRVILGIDYVIKEHDKKYDEIDEATRKLFLKRNIGKMKAQFIDDEVEFQISRNKKSGNKKFKENFLKSLTNFLNIEEVKPKSVVNMSVGGLKSRALNFAIDYATKLGIHFSVAAGNDHEDACLFSPGSSKNTLTVGASTKTDSVAFFSNIGQCVDIYAPGLEITSSWINNQIKIESGTSMATPHASGVIALYLGTAYYEPAELRQIIMRDSLKVIEDDDRDTDMLDFWPIKYFFGDEKENCPLISIKHLNEKIESNKD